MHRVLVGLLVVGAAGCPAPTHYAIVRPGLRCERAVRLAYYTMIQLGYTVTELVEPGAETPGLLVGTKPAPDGRAVGGRVRIECRVQGTLVQPVEDALVPADYEFSRTFDYSFTTLAQQPEERDPRAQRGLEVSLHLLPPAEQQLDLDGVATEGAVVLGRVTVRNPTERAVVLEASDIEAVARDGTTMGPLTGAARSAAIAPGPAGDRVRGELLGKITVARRTTVVRFVLLPAAVYREARFSITDVETGESDGFVAPIN